MKTPSASSGNMRAMDWIVLLLGLGIIAFLLWLFFFGGRRFLAESVTSRIVFPPDERTGAPQFDSSQSGSVPPGSPLIPLDTLNGQPTNFPKGTPSCPTGYRAWRDVVNGKFWCYPE